MLIATSQHETAGRLSYKATGWKLEKLFVECSQALALNAGWTSKVSQTQHQHWDNNRWHNTLWLHCAFSNYGGTWNKISNTLQNACVFCPW